MRGVAMMGLSAQAIAGGGKNHPWDVGDLLRCVNYCALAGISTAALQARMAGRSPEWDRLLPEWDNLATLLQEELATPSWYNMAPRTYREMKRVLDGGVACADCESTGRGAECLKCKGTGRRSGGRCRAAKCYSGADICPTCNGRGHTIPADREATR